MKKTKLELTIEGVPRSKKNSQQIIRVGGKPRLIQSKAYREYEKDAVAQIEAMHKAWHIDFPCNVKVIFYRPTRVRCDLTNLLEAIDDVLVKAGVIEDDNWKIIVAHDGSRIRFDSERPRTEVTITEMKDEF